jgi:hypothetical protein
MDKETELDLAIAEVVKMRDEKRPTLDQCVRVLDKVFTTFGPNGEFRQVARGPDQWSWLDSSNSGRGFDRWFILSESAMPGVEGYPLVTIRQATAPRLDAWLTVSQLLIGPSDSDVESSFAMLVANHHGAFDGLREMVSEMVNAVNVPSADLALPTTKRELN